jgi:hypothetical protein
MQTVNQYYRALKRAGGGALPEKLPSEVTGLHFWYDFTDFSTLTINAGDIQQINDKSGNGRHASQATAARRPLYNSTGLNGRPCAQFDETNDEYLQSITLGLTTYPVCIFAVVETITVVTTVFNPRPCYSLIKISTNSQYMYSGFANLNHRINANFRAAGTNYIIDSEDSPNENPVIFSQSLSATEHKIIKQVDPILGNGNYSIANASAWQGLDTLLLGRLRNVSSAFAWSGKISEIFIYSNEPSTADKNLLFNYLSNKYGLLNPVAV